MDLPSLSKIEEYVTIGTQKAYQGGIGVVSGGYSETKSVPPSITPEVYEQLLTELCSELREEGKQLIVSYDNMENIANAPLADFFLSIKDYLQIEGLHTIFIGPVRSLGAIERYQQVHSVFTQPTILDSLTVENVLEILRKRCENLKFPSGDYISPYDEETVSDVYNRLNNIRYTFKVLEDSTIYTEEHAPCKVTIKDIKGVQEREKKETLSKLTAQETKIMSALMDGLNKIQLSKLAKIAKIGSTNLTIPLKSLEEKGLIRISQSDEDKRFKYAQLSENCYLRCFYSLEKK
jgi:DNA-binding transcriptional ArsR family regulator